MILDELSKYKAKLDAMGSTAKEALSGYFHELELKFIYNTNSIAGYNISLVDTKNILSLVDTKNLFKDSVLNQKKAVDFVLAMVKKKVNLDKDSLVKINQLIDSDSKVNNKNLQEFINWYNYDNKYHAVEFAARVYGKLQLLKPFDKANNRTARLILNYILLKNGYPLTIIGIRAKEKYDQAVIKIKEGDYSILVGLLADYVKRSFKKYFDLIKEREFEDTNYASRGDYSNF